MTQIAKHQPINGRKLSQLTGIENSAVARTLNTLWDCDNPRIVEVFKDKCPITGHQSKFYKIKEAGEQVCIDFKLPFKKRNL